MCAALLHCRNCNQYLPEITYIFCSWLHHLGDEQTCRLLANNVFIMYIRALFCPSAQYFYMSISSEHTSWHYMQ